MDLNLYSTFICILVLSIHLNCVSSLKCYVCDTKISGQEDCLTIEPGSTKYLVDCQYPKDKTCRIHTQWIDFILDEPKDKDIVRQCGSSVHDPDNPCYYRTGLRGRLEICNCESDLCNTGSRTTSTLFGMIGLLFLVKYFFMRNA